MLLTVGIGATVVVVVVVVVAVQTPGVVAGVGATGGFFFTQSLLEQLLPMQTLEQ